MISLSDNLPQDLSIEDYKVTSNLWRILDFLMK